MRRGLPSRLFETIQETFACTKAPVFSYSCVPTQMFSLTPVFTKRHKIQDDTSLVGSRPDHLRKLTPCSQGSLILLTYLSSRKLRHFEIRRWAVFTSIPTSGAGTVSDVRTGLGIRAPGAGPLLGDPPSTAGRPRFGVTWNASPLP